MGKITLKDPNQRPDPDRAKVQAETLPSATSAPKLPYGQEMITVPKIVKINGERVETTQEIVFATTLTVREECTLGELIGREGANSVWVETVDACGRIRSIDGDPVQMPRNSREVWALVQRVGDEGIQDMRIKKLAKLMAAIHAAEEAAKNS